jgi:formylglycine-generating enzyme required for sulfatase activity
MNHSLTLGFVGLLLVAWLLVGCAGVREPQPARPPTPVGPESFAVSVPGSASELVFRRVFDPERSATFWLSETEVPWEAFDPYVFGFDIPRERRVAEWDASSRPSRPYGSPDRGWGHAGHAALAMTARSAEGFCAWLAEHSGLPLRLPTEEEWTLGATGGAMVRASIDAPPVTDRVIPAGVGQAVGWSSSEGPRPSALAELEPNELGLRGMLGNVGEWVRTSGEAGFVLAGGHFLDEPAARSPWQRELQARSWNATDPQNPKSAWWLADAPFVGFRVLCEAAPRAPLPTPEP